MQEKIVDIRKIRAGRYAIDIIDTNGNVQIGVIEKSNLGIVSDYFVWSFYTAFPSDILPSAALQTFQTLKEIRAIIENYFATFPEMVPDFIDAANGVDFENFSLSLQWRETKPEWKPCGTCGEMTLPFNSDFSDCVHCEMAQYEKEREMQSYFPKVTGYCDDCDVELFENTVHAGDDFYFLCFDCGQNRLKGIKEEPDTLADIAELLEEEIPFFTVDTGNGIESVSQRMANTMQNYEFESIEFDFQLNNSETHYQPLTMIATGIDNPIFFLTDSLADGVAFGWKQSNVSNHLYCYVERPMLAISAFSTTTAPFSVEIFQGEHFRVQECATYNIAREVALRANFSGADVIIWRGSEEIHSTFSSNAPFPRQRDMLRVWEGKVY